MYKSHHSYFISKYYWSLVLLNPGHAYATSALDFCVAFNKTHLINSTARDFCLIYVSNTSTCLLHIYVTFLESTGDLLINNSLRVIHSRC